MKTERKTQTSRGKVISLRNTTMKRNTAKNTAQRSTRTIYPTTSWSRCQRASIHRYRETRCRRSTRFNSSHRLITANSVPTSQPCFRRAILKLEVKTRRLRKWGWPWFGSLRKQQASWTTSEFLTTLRQPTHRRAKRCTRSGPPRKTSWLPSGWSGKTSQKWAKLRRLRATRSCCNRNN